MKATSVLLMILCIFYAARTETISIHSPDRSIVLSIHITDKITYAVTLDARAIITIGEIDLELNTGIKLSDHLRIQSIFMDSVHQSIRVLLPYRSKNIVDHYHEARIQFGEPFDLVVRVYNSGMAYRIETRFQDTIIIKNEIAFTAFSAGCTLTAPFVMPRIIEDRFHTSFEEPYHTLLLDTANQNQILYSPIVIDVGGVKIGVTESDLEDYPGMFLQTTGGGGIIGLFAPYPEDEILTTADFGQRIVTRRANYIAKIKGTRTLPWRVFMIAREDKDLPVNDMVYLLATPSKINDVSWIVPGLCTDEWIIDINLFNVPFKSGINTATYKYYIDFAHRFGFDRIMLDAGWSDTRDLYKINPNINMKEILAYAKSKRIKLNLWTLAATLDRQLDSAMTLFQKWGIDFIMTDFIDRDDQLAINFYKRIAEACAKNKIMVMFHGAPPPKGFNRTYPNNITREAVLGSEYNAWSDKATPEHNVTIPFTRMLAGPLDYEPGILDNATATQFKPIWGKVMSQGTRCHQLAMFIVYDSPLQIFAGNPSQGMMEPQFMDLLGSIPSTWDSTIILEAKLGDYIITARRSGKDWYIGGMTDWTARTFTLTMKFLDPGKYIATSCVDGINADRYPSDYKISSATVMNKNNIQLVLGPGGGGLIRLKKM